MKSRKKRKNNFPEMSFRLRTEIISWYSENTQELAGISLFQSNSELSDTICRAKIQPENQATRSTHMRKTSLHYCQQYTVCMMWLKPCQHFTQDKEICEACSYTKSFNSTSSTCMKWNLPATEIKIWSLTVPLQAGFTV